MKYLFTLLLLTIAADARLGETIDECRKRYGKETMVEDGGWETKDAHFKKNGLLIVAKIIEKKCVDITYVFPDASLKFRDRATKPYRLAPVIIRHLLNANGVEWVRLDWQAHHDSLKYISRDGSYATFTGQLVSFSNPWYAAKFAKIDYGKALVEGL